MLVLLTEIEILVHSSHGSDLGKVCPQYFHTYHTVPTGKLLTFILTCAELYFFSLILKTRNQPCGLGSRNRDTEADLMY